MGRILLAAALASAPLFGAPAKADDLRWQGTLFVTAVTPACAPAGGGAAALVGDQWTFVFRAADEGQSLSLIGQRRAMAFIPDGRTFKKAGKSQATYIGSNAVPRQAATKYSAFKFVPAKLDDGDRSVLISGKLADFDGAVGCEATFEASGVRRPGY